MPALTSTFLSLVPFAAAVFYIVYLQLERSELLQRLESIKLTENIDTPQASIDILTSPPSPFLSRNKANSAKLDQCMDSLARVNSESALLKYQALRKSAFFDGFNTIFQDPVLLVNKSKDLIPAALTAVKAMQMDSSSRISAIPSLVSSYQDFDTLPRLSNLVDISNHPDLYLIITLHPETTNLSNSKLMPPTHYPNPPRYYEMRTCHNALFSEFIHVTEESYRCVHDMNREEPTKDWPMDRPRYHLPTLVVTKNAEITDRGFVYKDNHIIIPSETCNPWHGAGQYYDPTVWSGGQNLIPQRITVDKPVLVLTEYWNGAIWHILGESFGRLAPHLESIKSNPDVLLHLSHDNRLNPISKKALDFFDIDASRVVLGNVVAPIVLFPEPTVLCCITSHYQTLALRDAIVHQLSTIFYPEIINNPKFKYKDYILVAKRTRAGIRKITNFDEMMAALKLALPNEEFVVFDDDPVPSLQESFWMFRHAKLIIAGHGASQTNIIACREGTILVEMLTNDHDIQVAYAVIGQQLGMVYHGFAPKHSAYRGQITADIDRLVGIVEKLKL